MNQEGIIIFTHNLYVCAYFSKQMIHELRRDKVYISITCARVSKQMIHELRRDNNIHT